MEISTLAAGERPALLDLLDLWPQPDGWSGPGFFRRYVEDDPSFVDQNYWVARDGGAPVACVQIFPRRIRLLGHSVPMGGIGSVFTHPDHRRKGLATDLLGRAAAAMREAGMELSLLFSDLHDFYGQWGWRPLALERSILRRAEAPPVPEESSDTLEIALFDRNLDYEAVKALYGSYSAARNCTVVRQGDLWDASFALAGNPREEFMVARRAGTPVAYVRAAVLNHHLCITELARADDASGPMAALVAGLLNPRELTLHLLASIRATYSPGTIRKHSGTLRAPERRIISEVTTKTAAGDRPTVAEGEASTLGGCRVAILTG